MIMHHETKYLFKSSMGVTNGMVRKVQSLKKNWPMAMPTLIIIEMALIIGSLELFLKASMADNLMQATWFT